MRVATLDRQQQTIIMNQSISPRRSRPYLVSAEGSHVCGFRAAGVHEAIAVVLWCLCTGMFQCFNVGEHHHHAEELRCTDWQ